MSQHAVSADYKSKCDLPAPHRHITTHKPDGDSVFYTDIPTELPCQPIRDDIDFYLGYTSSEFPVNINDDKDISNYRNYLEGSKPGITIKGGTVCRICNFAPNADGKADPMHRTISLDFGIVTAGEMECWLDSGEKRELKVGDVVVQRGTNHAWKNPSRDKWARMVFILQEAQPITVGSQDLAEDYGDIPGVESSS